MGNLGLLNIIFIFLLASFLGGLAARILKLQPFVGYIIIGILFGSFLPKDLIEIDKLAEIGAILLLFSLGLELSLSKLQRILKVAVWGGIIQLVFSSVLFFIILLLFGFSQVLSLILAIGFSLSSTAVVVKLLSEKGDLESVHGELMVGWLLVQDLAVLPIMIFLTSLSTRGGNWFLSLALMSAKGFLIIGLVVLLGRLILPYLIHKVASFNSRELLLLLSVIFALGTAFLVNLFGFSFALGAFLAGVVISDSQEKHAVFAETRSLRDLFVALFFVTLGFSLIPSVFIKSSFLILILVLLIFLVKFLVFLLVNFTFGYYGKAAIISSLGLTQVGEFSFIIFSQANLLGLISPENASLGIAVALSSLILSPIVFKYSYTLWKRLKLAAENRPFLLKYMLSPERNKNHNLGELSGHIVVCGFGRVGKWVCKALESLGIDFVIVDYNEKAIREAKEKGIKVIYGDASDPEIIKQAQVASSKCVVIAIPDKLAQEELITHIQTISPNVKIFARAHFDEDAVRLRFLRVDKVVQPEFEAAIGIVSSVLSALGKSNPEIKSKIRDLRRSHTISEEPSF
jgi:CPA2 family monovalent cation:H+ antiporter-2